VTRRTRGLLVATCVVALLAVAGPLRGQTPDAVKTSKPTVFVVEMTTTFVVPAGNDTIDQVRVYHALPTSRPWTPATAKHGASKLTFTPKAAEELTHEETGGRYLLWTVDGKQKAGTKLTFKSSMTVSSPDRSLTLKAVKTTWKDYEKEPKDKTAVVNPAVAKKVHPDLAKVAGDLKAKLPPAEAVPAMCKWIQDNLKYDASVTFTPADMDSIMKQKCGHCGHQAAVLEQLTASAGIPIRTVWGMNLYAEDGRTSELQKVRADYTNIHTWGEVYLPGVGWVEVDAGLGDKAFNLPARQIQNNRWFQNYSIWMREAGKDKQPTWAAVKGGFLSDYGVEHIISYKKK
jgi:transglutaminase-like putative cysteine protease